MFFFPPPPLCVCSNNWNVLVTQVSNILKYLFPVPKEDSRRVMTFANQEDFISFRSEFGETPFMETVYMLYVFDRLQ